VPFAIGEEFSSKWQFLPYIERGITNYARIDVCNVGGLTEAMVRFAVRYEYALTVEDVLARRSRLLFLDAHEAAKAEHLAGAQVEGDVAQGRA
jgi:glycerol-3-phosphate dehydrogenase